MRHLKLRNVVVATLTTATLISVVLGVISFCFCRLTMNLFFSLGSNAWVLADISHGRIRITTAVFKRLTDAELFSRTTGLPDDPQERAWVFEAADTDSLPGLVPIEKHVEAELLRL